MELAQTRCAGTRGFNRVPDPAAYERANFRHDAPLGRGAASLPAAQNLKTTATEKRPKSSFVSRIGKLGNLEKSRTSRAWK